MMRCGRRRQRFVFARYARPLRVVLYPWGLPARPRNSTISEMLRPLGGLRLNYLCPISVLSLSCTSDDVNRTGHIPMGENLKMSRSVAFASGRPEILNRTVAFGRKRSPNDRKGRVVVCTIRFRCGWRS